MAPAVPATPSRGAHQATGMPPQPPPAGRPPQPPLAPAASRWSWIDWSTDWLEDFPWQAWLGSALVHALLLVALSLILLSAPADEGLWLTSDLSVSTDMLDVAEMDVSEIPVEGTQPSLGEFQQGDEISLPGERAETVGEPSGVAGATSAVSSALASNVLNAPLAPIGDAAARQTESLANPLASRGGGLDGRTLENRRAAALEGGGTVESEAAVELALAWFAEHQWPDGGWRFDLETCPSCMGYCRNSGKHTSATAATGLALLSFLGAGYTHQEGKYQETVTKGLYFLNERMRVTSHGGDLRDSSAALEAEQPLGRLTALELNALRRDSMYSHGIAALAITEAYAMTKDRGLREPAEQAIKFIVSSQYDDGGWRYSPGFEGPPPGDTTVTTWQVVALKSASLAGIDVPYDVWARIEGFLDGVQEDGGSRYVYMIGRPDTNATTAAGLLCRMIGGWPRDHRPLMQGVMRLGAEQPERNNMYFNYYASQVLHHVGGAQWERWNPRMRDYLVDTQATDGHEVGSWYFAESHSTPGGRLYTTAMATMTLEVYYRYMPLYKHAFVDRAPR
jgi:hypothetical protein